MTNIYMMIQNILGNATTQGYNNAIGLRSLDLNAEREVHMHIGSAKNRDGELNISEVSITKSLDSATNPLFQSILNGTCIPKVEIHLCTADNPPQPMAKYLLSNVMLAEHSLTMAAGGLPLEKLRLSYTQLQITIIPRDGNNKPQAQNVLGFNLETSRTS